jgi:hypothetical protein
MSKDKNSKQMSLLEDSPANHSVLQENKKELTTTVISGQKCLDSSKKLNQSSLLGRMCKALLTSKTAWYSDRCKTNWKVKVSKSNVSLFQLQASVLGTKETESGLWATPNTMDYLPPRSAAGTKKLMEGHRKGRTKPSNLREQVDPETMKLYPTPNARDWKDSVNKVPPSVGKTRGHSLGQRIAADNQKKMYPTPRTGGGSRPNGKGGKVLEEEVMIEYGLRERGKTLKQMEEHKRMYPTPTQDSASERTKKYKQGGTPLTLAVQQEHKRMYPTPKASGQENAETLIKRKGAKAAAQHNLTANVQMWPTPSASSQMDVVAPPETVEKNSSGWSVRRVGTGTKFGAKLNDVVNKVSQPIEPGGKLNPTFVEFLMGFPESWTKIEPTESKVSETQSSHKSQESLGSQSKKFYRTPTAMDKGDNSFKYAAKFLKGKTTRSKSKESVQKTLSMDVAMEHLKENPELIELYDEKFKTRPHLPPKDIFLNYLKENLNKKELIAADIIKKTTIDHWLRSDHCFAYPTKEYWNMIKPYLKEIKFDYQMNFEIESDWE